MNKYLLILIFCCWYSNTHAQNPEPVLPFSVTQHPIEWYRAQAKAWHKEVQENPRDANAWYNLYYAQRLISFNDTTDKRGTDKKEAEMKALFKEMESNIPGTYEYNLAVWMDHGLDMKYLEYLKKADALGAGRTEHLDHMINIAEIERNISRRDAYAKRKYEAGAVSPGMLYYNYNVLVGLDTNAILLTAGDNDTYPAWVLQALGVRRDVTVLNLSLLLADDYRKELFTSLGVTNVTVNWDKEGEAAMWNFYKKVPQLLINNKKGRPLFISLTASYVAGGAEPKIEEELYLTGLAYKYNKTPIDNIAMLRRNFETAYGLDYLERSYYHDKSQDLVKRININYLVPMIKLYDHYKGSGDLQKQRWMEKLMMAVSRDTEEEDKVKKYLAR